MVEKKPEKPEEPKKNVAAKLFDDVKRPEETLASSTSKPVIVGHTNIIKDPMMSPTNTPESTDSLSSEKEEITSEKPKHELKLQPLTEAVKVDIATSEIPEKTDQHTTEDSESASESTLEEVDSLPEEVEDTADQQEQTSQTPASSTAAVDALADTITTKKDRNEDAKKQQVIDNEISELINSKQYNVKLRSAPSKRKAKLLLGLSIIAILALTAWYLGVGPGKDLWLEKTNISNKTAEPSPTTTQNAVQKTEQAPLLLAFTNSTIKTTFSYPKAWKVDVAKDAEYPNVDIITLTSPDLEVDSFTTTPAVKVGSFMRLKIFVENTKNTKEYASDLKNLSACSSEDIVVGSTNLKLLFNDTVTKSPNFSQVSLSPDVCSPTNGSFTANDQVQLTTKQNTYVVYAEYILSNAYLEKNGTKTQEAVKIAQESGIVTSKESFKSTKTYAEFLEIIKSLKEL